MAEVGWEFTKVFKYDNSANAGSKYIDITNDMQTPASTAVPVIEATGDYLYLGNTQKFDLAVFYLGTVGNLGALTWEYSTSGGNGFTEFIPASARWATDPDDEEGVQYAFKADGTEVFPANLTQNWVTSDIGNPGTPTTAYWIRVSAASVSTAPTMKRIQCRPHAIYTTSKQVFELLQLSKITNTTDFTDSTVPSKTTVDYFINESQAYIDMNTRKSWRPNYVSDEHHEFNLGGLKLEMPDAQRVLSLKIWNGAGWDIKRQGRNKDYFYVPETGMVHFARYFLLPARFQSYNAPTWRWGGGEFSQPVKITYLAGRDINTDIVQAGIVQEVCKKMVAIDVMRNADFGALAVSGMDRVSQSERMQQWQEEIEDRLDFLTAFETF